MNDIFFESFSDQPTKNWLIGRPFSTSWCDSLGSFFVWSL